LVISENLVNGFEHNIVINLSEPTHSSRSSGHLVITGQSYVNFHYMALPILDYLELNDYDCKSLCELYLDTPLDVIDNKLNKNGSSRLAVYTDVSKNNELLAALHFLLEENSLEEVVLKLKHQYESLEIELQKKLPPIFQVGKSSEDVLHQGFWQQLPKEVESLTFNALFESIARCSKRQISLIRIMNQRATLLNTFGRQFPPETNFCVVEFVYDSMRFPFSVTATQIQK